MVGPRAKAFLIISVLFWSVSAYGQADQSQVKQPVDVYLRSTRIALQTTPPEYARAMHNLELARKYYPENYEVHLMLGEVWSRKDEIDSMIAEYTLARKYAPPDEWQKKTKNLDKILDDKWRQRFNRAVDLLGQSDSIAELAQQEASTGTADSIRHVADQIREMSADALRQCALLQPEDFRSFATRGLLRQREGKTEMALDDFVEAERLFHRYEFGDSTTNWYDTTVFFTGPEGAKTEAYNAFDAKYKKLSEEKRTRYTNLMRSLGGTYYDLQKWPEAIAVNRRYHAMFPKDINTIVTLADIFSRIGDEQEAYKWQESVVREDPSSKDTWYNMGIFYYNAAIRLQDSLSQAERSDDKGAQREFWQKSLENFARAIPRFAKVVEIDAKDQDTWRLLAICYYSGATLAADAGRMITDTGEREHFLQGVLTLIFGAEEPSSAQKLWERARETLDKATGFFPEDGVLCKMMKITLAQLGQSDELKKWQSQCP
ncbi:MAG: tetratricopeptide repeat protein [Candidatus Zixiibacteriota bacterium]